MKNSKILIITQAAIMVALSTVLSLIKVYQLPFGGSITLLSMLPVMLVSIKQGVPWGLSASFVYAGIQLLLDLGTLMGWGMTPTVWLGCVIFDYLIPFTLLGVAGFLRKKGTAGILVGISAAMSLRFLSHLISGTIFFAVWAREGWSPLLHSVVYNSSYMLPELVFTLIGTILALKIPHLSKVIKSE